MDVGGIILCGGKSLRMGKSKAMLPFGEETMLVRITRLLGEVVRPLAVVAAPAQELPNLPPDVLVVRDRSEGRGPLEGLFGGLTALRPHVTAAYATGCDVPLLQRQFVRYLIERLGTHDAVVPTDGRVHHPLAAVYRTSLVAPIGKLLERDQLRMDGFYDQVATCRVPIDELRHIDPDLRSLMNVNRPEQYAEALHLAGLA